jgi:nitrate/TMAO reductase-like tetraheme cytochrome c subunit
MRRHNREWKTALCRPQVLTYVGRQRIFADRRMNRSQKLLLFAVIVVLPALLALTTAKVSFSRAQQVSFCASCHTMTPWIDDVTGDESESLAHDHFANRWIQHDQCFTCHSNYSFLGPIEAKIKGMRHVAAFYLGEDRPIELYGEFPNENCLQCHAEAKGFLEESSHEPIEDLLSGKDRCVECHESFHDVEQAADAETGGEAEDKGENEGGAKDAPETED